MAATKSQAGRSGTIEVLRAVARFDQGYGDPSGPDLVYLPLERLKLDVLRIEAVFADRDVKRLGRPVCALAPLRPAWHPTSSPSMAASTADQAEYPGGKCQAPVRTGVKIVCRR